MLPDIVTVAAPVVVLTPSAPAVVEPDAAVNVRSPLVKVPPLATSLVMVFVST